jgi:hypothetical protein
MKCFIIALTFFLLTLCVLVHTAPVDCGVATMTEVLSVDPKLLLDLDEDSLLLSLNAMDGESEMLAATTSSIRKTPCYASYVCQSSCYCGKTFLFRLPNNTAVTDVNNVVCLGMGNSASADASDSSVKMQTVLEDTSSHNYTFIIGNALSISLLQVPQARSTVLNWMMSQGYLQKLNPVQMQLLEKSISTYLNTPGNPYTNTSSNGAIGGTSVLSEDLDELVSADALETEGVESSLLENVETEGFDSFISGVGNDIKGALSNIAGDIKSGAESAFNGIKTGISDVGSEFGNIGSDFTAGFGAVKNAAVTAANAVKNTAVTAGNAIKNTAVKGFDEVKNVALDVASVATELVDDIEALLLGEPNAAAVVKQLQQVIQNVLIHPAYIKSFINFYEANLKNFYGTFKNYCVLAHGSPDVAIPKMENGMVTSSSSTLLSILQHVINDVSSNGQVTGFSDATYLGMLNQTQSLLQPMRAAITSDFVSLYVNQKTNCACQSMITYAQSQKQSQSLISELQGQIAAGCTQMCTQTQSAPSMTGGGSSPSTSGQSAQSGKQSSNGSGGAVSGPSGVVYANPSRNVISSPSTSGQSAQSGKQSSNGSGGVVSGPSGVVYANPTGNAVSTGNNINIDLHVANQQGGSPRNDKNAVDVQKQHQAQHSQKYTSSNRNVNKVTNTKNGEKIVIDEDKFFNA